MRIPRDCERARVNLMALLDGEHGPESAGFHQHAASCASCREWRDGVEMLIGDLRGLAYPRDDVDLWAAVQHDIRRPVRPYGAPQLWPIAATLVAWRALQLFIDLPLPVLHALVPLAATAVVLWRAGGDVLRIETLAPELQKRGL